MEKNGLSHTNDMLIDIRFNYFILTFLYNTCRIRGGSQKRKMTGVRKKEEDDEEEREENMNYLVFSILRRKAYDG